MERVGKGGRVRVLEQVEVLVGVGDVLYTDPAGARVAVGDGREQGARGLPWNAAGGVVGQARVQQLALPGPDPVLLPAAGLLGEQRSGWDLEDGGAPDLRKRVGGGVELRGKDN